MILGGLDTYEWYSLGWYRRLALNWSCIRLDSAGTNDSGIPAL